jgi:hypothetical protein
LELGEVGNVLNVWTGGLTPLLAGFAISNRNPNTKERDPSNLPAP